MTPETGAPKPKTAELTLETPQEEAARLAEKPKGVADQLAEANASGDPAVVAKVEEALAEKYNIPGEKPSDKLEESEAYQENLESSQFESAMNDRISEQNQAMLKFLSGEIDKMPIVIDQESYAFSTSNPKSFGVPINKTKPKNKELRDSLLEDNKVLSNLLQIKRGTETIKYQQKTGGYMGKESELQSDVNDYGQYQPLADKIRKEHAEAVNSFNKSLQK